MQLTKHFVDHRRIRLAPHGIPELPLDGAEGRFDVTPLVFKEWFPLRFANSIDEPYPLTLEGRCSGLSYLIRCMATPGHPLPADIDRAIAEFEEARQERPVLEAHSPAELE